MMMIISNNNDDDDDNNSNNNNNNNNNNITSGHWVKTGWCLNLPRESRCSRPPESGVAPLTSASNPLPPSSVLA